MKHAPVIFIFALALALMNSGCSVPEDTPTEMDIFAQHNLLAWCIVPYDANERTPRERARMLAELGFTKMAYDWRERHLPEFGNEIEALQEHDIELAAVWLWIDRHTLDLPTAEHEYILETLEIAGIRTALWLGIDDGVFDGMTEDEKIAEAVRVVETIYSRAKAGGNSITLYNHGGWFGEPENQVRIIRGIGADDIGIVYNFHHGHAHIERFSELLEVMLPYLRTVNLNGMEPGGAKILTIGEGSKDAEMIASLKSSGFTGTVGIIGHTEGEDVREVLARNVEGLNTILGGLSHGAGTEGPAGRNQ